MPPELRARPAYAAALARAGLIDVDALESRATEALAIYVSDTARVRGTIAAAKRLVASARR